MKKILKTVLLTVGIVLFISCLPIIFLIFLFLPGELDEAINKYDNARRRIEARMEVELSEDLEIVYHVYQSGFQDDLQYTCFKFENASIDWLNENGFSEKKNEEFERAFGGFYDGWGGRHVPEEYQANFENRYFWLKEECNFLIYFPDKGELIGYLT